ncbi:MAG: DUF3592 domain-containing protein [Bacteroides sp.]|nr:DUF3592 domain-containing protein [Bacteroides sp.]
MNPKLLGLILVIAGTLAFYFFSLPDLQMAQESAAWPKTRGIITRSETERVESGSGSDRKVSYRADVQYAYKIEGKSYSSTKIGITSGTSYPYRMADRICSKYQKGTPVEVFYQPGDPSVSVLKPGVQFSEILVAGSLLFFALLGFLILFNIIKASPDKNKRLLKN